MRFTSRKNRNPPTIILVSLIDVLIVLLIFLMVSTTFKQYPALKLALPESTQSKKSGATEANLVVTISKQPPYLFLGTKPVTDDSLEAELAAAVARNPQVTLAIRPDTEAPFGQIVKVMNAAKAARIKSSLSVYIKPAQEKNLLR
ncbi:MAG: biopolymer transporter ExbD [Candidatus Omnitrophica bacterium]|nr:biopolymer transporter ExbD [Candidatus Omnitrophota bacterium]